MPLWLRTNGLPVAGAAAASLVVAVLMHVMGPRVLVLLAALAIAVVLLANARWSVTVLCGAALFAESNPNWGLPTSSLYTFVGGAKLTGVDVLLVLAIVSVALEVVRSKRTIGLGAFAPAFFLLTAALIAGLITGYDAGSSKAVLQSQLSGLLPLLVVPLLVVQVVDTSDRLRWALGMLAAMMLVKGALGPLLVFAGRTVSASTAVGFVPTYLESPMNFLSIIVLATGLAALLARVSLPRWVWVTMPITLACLLLSYRRSFWIAAAAALALVTLLGSGRVGRRMLVPGLVVVVAAGALVATTSGGFDTSGPVGQRFETLNPSKIKTNTEDRYRLGERRSVLADLRDSPIAGLGVGVGWKQRYPLSETHVNGRQYVHTGLLWWWMQLGILGLLGYVALIVTAIGSGLAVWRRSADPVVRVAGLGLAMAFIGYSLAELTATFTGAEVRENVFVGLLAGLLSSALRLARLDAHWTPAKPG